MREKMEDVRGPRVVLISLLSTGDARGANSLLWVCGFVVKDVAIIMLVVHLSALSCAVSLSVNLFFQPTQLSDVR